MSIAWDTRGGKTRIAWPGNVEDEGWPTPPDRVGHTAAMLEVGGFTSASSETLVDVLADLMHYAEAKGLDWVEAEGQARRHYDVEREGPNAPGW